jgi:NADH dehydrogenase FAD-containing subunit
VVKDFAKSIDTARKTVTLGGGATIAYDKLVVSPGIDLMFGSIEGLQAANASARSCKPGRLVPRPWPCASNWKPCPTAASMR